MSREITTKLDTLLQGVPTSRRQALRRLLAGAGALALLPSSTLLAQAPQPGQRPGRGEGWRHREGQGPGQG